MDNAKRNLMLDFAAGQDIYDVDQNRVVTKAEVNDKIRKICFEELGLDEHATDKQIKRALKSEKAISLFEVVEEAVDVQIRYGLSENEFFNQFVETKNLADGDRTDFWVEDEDLILTVSKISGDHHDMTLQRLASGQTYSVPTAKYGIKVGGDIREFLLGRKDWSKFVEAIARAYMNKIQTIISAQFSTGVNLIPVPSTLTGTGALSSSTKAQFDAIIEKVETSNGCPVVIMGTKTALKNLNALTKVDWADPAASVKEAVASTGIIGSYEGTNLMVIPQKYEDKTLTTPVVANNKLYVMPVVDNKFIKFVDGGQTELEIAEVGATMDDNQSLEAQRTLGVATLLTRYYGVWTI